MLLVQSLAFGLGLPLLRGAPELYLGQRQQQHHLQVGLSLPNYLLSKLFLEVHLPEIRACDFLNQERFTRSAVLPVKSLKSCDEKLSGIACLGVGPTL